MMMIWGFKKANTTTVLLKRRKSLCSKTCLVCLTLRRDMSDIFLPYRDKLDLLPISKGLTCLVASLLN